MKSVLITFITLIISHYLFAQNSYCVKYKIERHEFRAKLATNNYGDSISVTTLADTFYRTLIFNDVIAYSILESKRPKKRKYSEAETYFGDNPSTGDYYYDKINEKWLYYTKAYRRKAYFVEFPTTSSQFIVKEDSIYIAGLICQKGYAILLDGDTVFATICRAFKNNYGPFAYNFLPGLIIEMYQPAFNQYTSLLSIKNGQYSLDIPDVPQIDRNEFEEKYWKNKIHFPGRREY